MKLVREAYYSWGAEVVFITSNYQGNKEIMEGCKMEGIPAFVSDSFSWPASETRLTDIPSQGTLWDF